MPLPLPSLQGGAGGRLGVAGAAGATLLGKQCPNIVRFCETCAESGGFAGLMMVKVAEGAFVWLEKCFDVAIELL